MLADVIHIHLPDGRKQINVEDVVEESVHDAVEGLQPLAQSAYLPEGPLHVAVHGRKGPQHALVYAQLPGHPEYHSF